MFDVILRALRHPLDYILVLNHRTLVLKEVIQETEDIYSFIFTPKRPFSWKAGQHGIFHFPGVQIPGKWWRAFSIASSSHEGVVRISTIIKGEPSAFKEHLRSLKAGDEIGMFGPFGEFHTRPQLSHIIGIAGGIGITPFRALALDIANSVIADTKLTLLYSSLGAYAFRDELEALATRSRGNIEIIYTVTPDEVNATLDRLVATYGNSATYFISGSPGMIKALRKSCKLKGVKKIVNDSFKGY